MLARLQQILTLVLLLAALGLAAIWGRAPALAAGGLLLLASGHAYVLALEFVAAWCLNRRDPASPASLPVLVRAWGREVLLAPRVFLWQQPWRWRAVSDALALQDVVPGRRGMVFIHGFVCNRGYWNPWLYRLRGSGHAYVAVNLEPVFGSIDAYVAQIEAAVQQVTTASGGPPLLVCHSMGGLAVRAWLRAYQADARVHHVVTLGTPHHGTWLARFSNVVNGRQMAPANAWLQQLAQEEPAERQRLFTCYYSNCDNIVFPATTATLPEADNRFLPGISHVALGLHPRVMQEVLAQAGLVSEAASVAWVAGRGRRIR